MGVENITQTTALVALTSMYAYSHQKLMTENKAVYVRSLYAANNDNRV